MKKELLMLGTATLILAASCKKTAPTPPNEEEVITTLTYKLTPTDGGNAVELKYTDLDGEGGNPPIISTGTLQANTTYNANIVLLNEQANPVEDVTEEIKEEDKEHQFFFNSTVPGLTVAYMDSDDDNNPLGVKTKVTTTSAGNGKFQIILRHEPNKNAAGVKDGDITNAGGSTDIDVTFNVDVQ